MNKKDKTNRKTAIKRKPETAGKGALSANAWGCDTALLKKLNIDFVELLNYTYDAIHVLDRDGRYIYVNQTLVRNTGISAEKFLNSHYLDFIIEPYKATVQEHFERALTGETAPPFEIEYKSQSDEILTIQISASPIIRDGEVIAVVVSSRDVTKERKVENDLRVNEKKYRLLAENVSDVIWTSDTALNFTYISPSIKQLMGYTPEEMIGMELADILTPESTQRVSGILTHELEMENNPAVSPDRLLNIEIEQIHQDGSIIPVEISVSILRDKSKKFIGLLGVTRDITVRKKTEETLRQAEERYRLLVDNMLVGLFIVNMTTLKVNYINQKMCEIFGYTMDEAKQLSVWDVVVPEEHPVIMGRIREMIEKNLPHSDTDTYDAHKKDGTPLRVIVNTVLITYRGETCLQGIVMDVTEKEALERQLINAQKIEAIGTLAGGIAHDFNNLLMGIQGNASLLSVDMTIPEDARERLNSIQEYVQSGVALTKQLLGFARSGKYEVRPININELIIKSSDMFARTHKEISIHRKLSPELMAVEADAGQIEQVLINLYVNAWQAMPNGGAIYLQTENREINEKDALPLKLTPGNYIRIMVTDTGIGMDDETRMKIFDPFFTTKEIGRGTGLGLSSAYGIITGHGGSITVSSHKDEGASFEILLKGSEKEPVVPERPEESIKKGNETILLIDDEDMIRRVARQLLVKLGYSVLTASSGNDALKLYGTESKNISLVILDMIMPGMSGEETFRKLHEIDEGVKILLSSGYTLDERARPLIEQGQTGFINKPYTLKQLSMKLREMIDRHGRVGKTENIS